VTKGVSPSGRALRFVLWRLPLGVTRYSMARNTAVMTEEGRRVLALAAFGLWVAVFWYAATALHSWLGVVVPLQLAGLFGLLLIWRIVGHLRRWWVQRHNLKNQAVSMQRQRQMYEMQAQALGYVQQLARQAIPGGTFTMLGSMRQHDPVHEQARQQAATDAELARSWLPEESRDMPLGDRFEPMVRPPRWMRRRWEKRSKQDGDQ
jgi:hypothetical protein